MIQLNFRSPGRIFIRLLPETSDSLRLRQSILLKKTFAMRHWLLTKIWWFWWYFNYLQFLFLICDLCLFLKRLCIQRKIVVVKKLLLYSLRKNLIQRCLSSFKKKTKGKKVYLNEYEIDVGKLRISFLPKNLHSVIISSMHSPQWVKSRNLSAIFNMKSISLKITHLQSWKSQANLWVKSWKVLREKRQQTNSRLKWINQNTCSEMRVS